MKWEVKMQRYIGLLFVISIVLCSCGDDEPDTIIIIGPHLPKIDCEDYVNRVAADASARLGASSPATIAQIEKARSDCEKENESRGY